MNTAQQVRVWVSVGVGVLLAICCIGMAASLTAINNFNGTGNTALFTLNDSAFAAWFVLALICLVAEAILAGFTVYRMYRPLAKPDPAQAQAPWQAAAPPNQAPWQATAPPTQAPWQAGAPQAQAPWQASPPPTQAPWPASAPQAPAPGQGPSAQDSTPRDATAPSYAAREK